VRNGAATSSSSGVRLEDLVAGNPQAYVTVHLAAMLSLVSDPDAAVCHHTVPETLLFDVRRLSLLRDEFDRVTCGVTLLVMANHAINDGDQAKKRAFMAELTALVAVDGPVDLASVVAVDLPRMLSGAGLLLDSAERVRVLEVLARGVTDRNDHVRQLM
jgi:hypothetical protein